MALQNTVRRGLSCNASRQWMLGSMVAWMGGQAIQLPQRQRRAVSRESNAQNVMRKQMRLQDEGHVLNDISEEFEEQDRKQAQEARRRAREPKEQETVGIDALEQAAAAQSTKAEKGPPKESSFAPDANPAIDLPPADPNIPWYLQVDQPDLAPPPSPLAARQRLPDLPANAPALLQPILNHVSVELGMDDLTLLDLRSLDPPPALGANLLMIIGTARSEKHLHVSADRLCRWLRTEYRMTPFADGLLGRNELKLKMRRRAKKSRLLSAVGAKATADSEIDDGIRTGWVCVNAGRVEGGELPEDVKKNQRAEGVVGFGARTEGSSIVVQMLTDEKRGEVDLEKLWSGIMKRARREDEAAEAKVAEANVADAQGAGESQAAA